MELVVPNQPANSGFIVLQIVAPDEQNKTNRHHDVLASVIPKPGAADKVVDYGFGGP